MMTCVYFCGHLWYYFNADFIIIIIIKVYLRPYTEPQWCLILYDNQLI
jgi:hypothetical protein